MKIINLDSLIILGFAFEHSGNKKTCLMDKTVKESRLNHWFILIKECLYQLRVLNKLYIKIGLRSGEKKTFD